jgi:hypothetical protein
VGFDLPIFGRLWYNKKMKSDTKHPSKRAAKTVTIGRDSFAKISAVEGIRLTPTMVSEFREFERKGLSPAARRKAIIGKYGKTRT